MSPGAVQRLAAEHALPVGCALGEGPRWDVEHGVLSWVDIHGCAIHRWSPETNESEITQTSDVVGAVAATSDGRTVAAIGTSIVLDPGGPAETLLAVLPAADRTQVRCNDGRAGPDGAFWIGTMALDHRSPVACLYRVAPDGSVTVHLEHLTISNGLGWSSDGEWFYHIDTPSQTVTRRRFSVDTLGRDVDVLTRLDPSEGSPDGLAVDAEGGVWVALWGAGQVRRYDSSGQLDTVITTPGAPYVTALTFGGAELNRLFITTARPEAEQAGSHGGDLFICDVDTTGLREGLVSLGAVA